MQRNFSTTAKHINTNQRYTHFIPRISFLERGFCCQKRGRIYSGMSPVRYTHKDQGRGILVKLFSPILSPPATMSRTRGIIFDNINILIELRINSNNLNDTPITDDISLYAIVKDKRTKPSDVWSQSLSFELFKGGWTSLRTIDVVLNNTPSGTSKIHTTQPPASCSQTRLHSRVL